MLSDDELPPLPPMRCAAIPGPRAYINWFSTDQMREYARDVERAAYERAAQECEPHDDDDSIDRQIKREIAERIRALGRKS